jgi:NAD(P)-dependent dehydrogenase (short-subunit alcohol dehydrogenase family)
MKFENKIFLVVGASSGIGEDIAGRLVRQGATVITLGRTTPNVASTHISWDAQHPTDFSAALPDSLHGVVYCPGTINLKPFTRLSATDFSADWQINVLGAVQVLQVALPKLRKAAGASVLLFSTVAVQTGMSFHASVAASKGAVEGLTRSLAAEYASAKIRFNCMAPSLTDTPLAAALLSSDEKREASAKRHPLGRVGNAADLGAMAELLLSDESSWITGQVLHIDGGMGALK